MYFKLILALDLFLKLFESMFGMFTASCANCLFILLFFLEGEGEGSQFLAILDIFF